MSVDALIGERGEIDLGDFVLRVLDDSENEPCKICKNQPDPSISKEERISCIKCETPLCEVCAYWTDEEDSICPGCYIVYEKSIQKV